ncbi:MAG: hypothetical protein J5944_08595 [Lentisphaeria bacterium]|nr:hypothetical protein [Lentisphaeria bacterium]
MILLHGFFSTLWGPMGVSVVVGIVLMLFFVVWKGIRGWELPLLVLVIFLFCAVWRIPLINTERYTLPLVIPGILLMTALAFALLEFRKILPILPVPTVLLILVVALAVGMPFKALRPRKEKPHLTEITRIIEAERQTEDGQHILLLIFGNLGGVLQPDGIDIHNVQISKKESRARYYAQAVVRLAKTMSLWKMHTCYDRVFVVCMEDPDPVFQNDWAAVYGEPLKLRYEFLTAYRDRGYRLYEVPRTSAASAILRDPEVRKSFFREHNLLGNGDFSEVCAVTRQTPFVKKIADKGYSFFKEKEFRFPAQWEFNPDQGFRKHFWSFFRFGFQETEAKGNSCNMTSNSRVSLWHTGEPLPPGRYAALVFGRSSNDTIASFEVACRKENRERIAFRGYCLLPGREDSFDTVIPFEIPKDCTGQPMLSLYRGILSVSGVFVVPMETFERKEQDDNE